MKKNTKHVLSFATLNGTIKYYAAGKGELSNGEQTTDIRKAAKFDTSKQAEKVNATLNTWYFRNSTQEIAPNIWTI
jgi:hypothetical protein